MIETKIVLDGDGRFPELQGRKVHTCRIHSITGLPGGLKSGRASAAVIIDLPDGSVVFAETSMRILLCALRAFQARYGHELEGP